jgi:hypothetical protein
MPAWLKHWWWPLTKALVALIIIFYIGRQFAHDLDEPGLWDRRLRGGWLVLSGVLYLLALGCSALFWYRLLRVQGQHPAGPATVRAYYIGLLGKYTPVKAWALVVRATLIHGPGVRGAVAGVTAFYEVLTTMATGALLAALIFVVEVPDWLAPVDGETLGRLVERHVRVLPLDHRLLALVALGLAVMLGAPLWPRLYNRLMRRLAGRFGDSDAVPLPLLRPRALAEGIALMGLGWVFYGTSLLAMIQAVLEHPPAWTTAPLVRFTACMALAYVAGFVIFWIPSGLVVREHFLKVLLVPELAGALAPGEGNPVAVVGLLVVILRLVWTIAELVIAGVVYWLPGPPKEVSP